MITENGELVGDLRLETDLALNGMVAGDLIVEPGATVTLKGMVTGAVSNQGGNLMIYGMVNGPLHRDGGSTTVDADAMIRGRRGG